MCDNIRHLKLTLTPHPMPAHGPNSIHVSKSTPLDPQSVQPLGSSFVMPRQSPVSSLPLPASIHRVPHGSLQNAGVIKSLPTLKLLVTSQLWRANPEGQGPWQFSSLILHSPPARLDLSSPEGSRPLPLGLYTHLPFCQNCSPTSSTHWAFSVNMRLCLLLVQVAADHY